MRPRRLGVVAATLGPPKLSVHGVTKSYVSASGQAVEALRGLTFDVAPGEFVCLIGPSGSGKTTILNLLAGLDRPNEGEILLDGRPITEPGPERALLFQEPALFSWLSVRGNVEYPLRVQGMERDEARAVVDQWLAKVRLTPFANARPHELSAGMRQRTALARALASQPEVLLADEPFGALDAQARELLQQELQLVWGELRNTLVFVTHNVREAAFLADRVLVLAARPGTAIEEYRITTPRPRSFDDALLAKVVEDIHDQVLEEVQRSGVEVDVRPGLA